MILLEIPSPPSRGFFIGPFEIRYYALFILAGIFLAAWLGSKRFVARGGSSEKFDASVLVTVLVGIVGARLYHVITDYQLYFGPGRNPWQAFNIRAGGLGIWGGVALGAVALWFMCRRYRLDFGSFADVLAPGVLFAQAIGRLGNWFNQELFGRPTTLPWGLHIDPQYRPDGYEQYDTFHPTFLYELVWDTAGGFVLLWVERRFKLGRGKLFTAYVAWYTFGRFFIEALRIDPVNHVGAFRLNNYVSVIVFVAAVATLVWQLRRVPGVRLWPFGFAVPQGSLVPARPRPERAATD
ncbi:prolipoprotein diacylglyceryl transferase [Brooklawnia cerclae]|uniref:Phosphatidylglycerol--prolipoprotein diacylglyceryl transferase n=1 Tax=Brooklawnia cerclae TaxID=349934 RepID=A0ABX0SDK7_9ACTN|nr:prolipoprotein diacylglyceryl transferase [Brooklawnia cerclae]NIH56480.1 prolipoprotein diacylglyceryl transferase [Brooklawnia cerclae]